MKPPKVLVWKRMFNFQLSGCLGVHLRFSGGGLGSCFFLGRKYGTPRKTNMEPENEALEEEIPIRNHHFQVPC